jgi:hypothetical protein
MKRLAWNMVLGGQEEFLSLLDEKAAGLTSGFFICLNF